MKNWDLFVSGPEFAMARMPRVLNYQGSDALAADELGRIGPGRRKRYTLRVDRISSAKGLPHMLWPPLPEPEGSPVWITKPLMFLCQRQLS